MESVAMECCKPVEVEKASPSKKKIPRKRADKKAEFAGDQDVPTGRVLQRKWRKRSKRPGRPLAWGSGASPLGHFVLFGCDVRYRVCGTIVMFETDQILSLTKTALGLRADIGASTAVGAILRHLRVASKYELLLQDQDQSWVRTHISWKAYRDLVDEAVYDVALKEMLKTYVPFESAKTAETCDADRGDPPTLEQDSLKIMGITVPFVVHKGRIFLDLLASFTILGQLRLAFMNRWERVDEILDQQGLNHKDAFRRNHKCRTKERRWTSQRSHITFKAIKVLASNGLVEDSSRKRTLEQLFNHLESEINRITSMKKTLLDTIEQKVVQLLRDFGHPTQKVEEMVEDEQDELVGTELCSSGCGRQYHFTLRCCLISHQIFLCGKPIGYIIHQNRVFLEKCGAFAALGRMYVIRCSDYRKSDKALSSSGLKPKKHYLFEKHTSPDQNTHSKRRNRRTHISFEAFKVLVNSGFSEMAKNKELAEATEQIKVESLHGQCVKFVPEKSDSHGKQDSSSGVESGSSNSGSGTNSPILFSDQYASEPNGLSEKDFPKPVEISNLQRHDFKGFSKIKVLGQSINIFSRDSSTYLSVADVCQCLASSERSLPRMRRLARDLELIQGPAFKKLHGQIYVSSECFVKLLDSEKITPIDLEFSESVRVLFSGQRSENSLFSSSDELKNSLKKKFSNLKSAASGHAVTINDIDIPIRVEKDLVYLEKKSVFKLLNIQTPAHIAFRAIDKALESQNISIDSSFLYDGRCRSYISTQALRVVFSDKPLDIENILSDLEKRAETFKINRCLKLTSFNNIPIKVIENSVYLCTIHFMSAAGFSKSAVLNYTSKSFATLVRLLKRRGLNTNSCFLKWGKSKYANLSVLAAMTLMKTEFGPFRDRKRMNRLKGEILSSLKENGISFDECIAAEEMAKKSPEVQVKEEKGPLDNENDGQSKFANLDCLFPPIRYLVKDGTVYLHRKTSFEAIGAETLLLSNVRGFASINNILLSNKLQIRDCFISGNQEQYAYISIQAIIILLESDDPVFSTAGNKDLFYHGLFMWISKKIKLILTSFSTFPLEGLSIASVPYLVFKDRLFLHLRTSFAFSGLYDKRSWENGDNEIVLSEMDEERINAIIKSREHELQKLEYVPDGDDLQGFIPVDVLMVLTRVDGGAERVTDHQKLIWKDMIHAILHEEPKLRAQVKIIEFRESLLSSLLRLLVASLTIDNTSLEAQDFKPFIPFPLGQSCPPSVQDLRVPKIEQVIQSDTGEAIAFDASLNERPASPNGLSKENFTISRSDFDTAVDHARKSLSYGDWQVKFCSDSEIRFFVSPGFGASKKPSFLQPDMWAILSYELCLRPDMTPDFFINGHRVPDDKFCYIFSKSITKGMFNLLYSLLILRPCFGAFSPELVETFQKKEEEDQFQDLILDTHFVGSSQSGRTYAGCIRSRDCSVLAQSRISDTCNNCAKLAKIVINRSVLTTPDHVNSKNNQLSVWIVEESSVDGCIFLCPQLQSFNTSLPHQFQTDNQATSIVSHRVFISNDLQIRVSLNETPILAKTFPGDFATNKQVGPLLDWVASLRLCIGYPDPVLVKKARFISFKKHLVAPETRKYFDYIIVDENFEWKKQNSSLSTRGTLRTQSCRFVAEDFADVCSQCRLLQQALDCLAVK